MSFINKIVSAANVYQVTLGDVSEQIVIPDNCHMGRNMQVITKLFRQLGCEVKSCNHLEDRGQGFIDESGIYYDRKQSYVIAKASGQPFNDNYTLPGNRLDSSCVRHFASDKTLHDYMPRSGICNCGSSEFSFSDITNDETWYKCTKCSEDISSSQITTRAKQTRKIVL